MPILTAENHFRKGLVALVDNDPAQAVTHFQSAILIERQRGVARPQMRYLSYYGLALAKAQGANFEAVHACEAAARRDFFNPDLLLNLGKVYILAGKTTRALAAFERGLALAPNHPALNQEVIKYERRKVPPISVLSRRHPVNKWLGRVRSSFATRARTMLSWRTVTPS